MIAYLKGVVLNFIGPQVVLLCENIGYRIHVKPDVLLLPTGSRLELYTYHKSTDDGQSLYGFSDVEDLKFFELLITVSGVGPKSAMGIISATSRSILAKAIADEDSAFFSKMGGIGKKTAEKIILELKSKVGKSEAESVTPGSSDVFDALSSLGYNPGEIRNALQNISPSLSTEEKLKEALRSLSKK